MPMWCKMSLQDSNSPMMEQLSFFHDQCMTILLMIMTITGIMATMSMLSKMFSRSLEENEEMEIFWSVLPAVLLIMIAIPSMKMLFLAEEPSNSPMSMKIMGNQWYWSYQYSEMPMKKFNSFMEKSDFRLMSTSNFVSVPSNVSIRTLVSSSDVIHSWTVPSAGIKMDAIPGRLNQMNMMFSRVGNYYGQCSEVCGMKHSFMPISMAVSPLKEFMINISTNKTPIIMETVPSKGWIHWIISWIWIL